MIEFETPSMIESMMTSVLEDMAKNKNGEMINFKDFNEITEAISKRLKKSGIGELEKDVEGINKALSTRVILDGKDKILKFEFVFNNYSAKAYLKSIEIKNTDTLN